MNLFREIWATARQNKLRTALTGFSVAWGIFILIVLLGAGNGLINATRLNQSSGLANSMTVYGGYTSVAHAGLKEGRSITLDGRDIAATRHDFAQNVDEVGAVVSHGDQTVSVGQNYLTGQSLVGVCPSLMEMRKLQLVEGRFVNENDLRERRKVLVIDDKQARELAPNRRQVAGTVAKVGGMAFRIVGVTKADNTRSNDELMAPLTTVATIYGTGDRVDQIEFTFHGLPTEEDNERFEAGYRARINGNHLAAPSDDNAIWLWNRFTDNLQMEKAMGMLHAALWVVGLLTLLSGVVGVSNIMLITVRERTREFGIRKAIGATPWSILRLIVAESVAITTIFGYVGMVCGVAANAYMDHTVGHTAMDTGLFSVRMFVNPTVGLDICLEATLVIIVAGTLAGLVPAAKAARTRPIEAMRE